MGGIGVRLRASSLARALALAAFTGELEPHSGAPLLHVLFGPRSRPLPAVPGEELSEDLAVWRTPDALVVRHRMGLNAWITAEGVRLEGGCADLREPLRYLFPLAVTRVLCGHGRLVLHAGAIRSDRDTLLILGETGAGKSTAVLAAILSGWLALSDDLVALRVGTQGLEVRGLPKPLAIPADVVPPCLPGLRPVRTGSRRRWVLDGHPWDRGWHRVAGTVVVTHAPTSLATLDPVGGSALFRLVLSSVPGIPEPGVARLAMSLAAALSRAPACELGHAPDPSTRVIAAARLLDAARYRAGGAAASSYGRDDPRAPPDDSQPEPPA